MSQCPAVVQTVVLALGPGSRMTHVRQLAAALEAIQGRSKSLNQRSEPPPLAAKLPLPEMRLTPRQAFFARTER